MTQFLSFIHFRIILTGLVVESLAYRTRVWKVVGSITSGVKPKTIKLMCVSGLTVGCCFREIYISSFKLIGQDGLSNLND
jgi:hypothetical protein